MSFEDVVKGRGNSLYHAGTKNMPLLHGGQAGTFAQIEVSYSANVIYSVTAYNCRGRNRCTSKGENVTTPAVTRIQETLNKLLCLYLRSEGPFQNRTSTNYLGFIKKVKHLAI